MNLGMERAAFPEVAPRVFSYTVRRHAGWRKAGRKKQAASLQTSTWNLELGNRMRDIALLF